VKNGPHTVDNFSVRLCYVKVKPIRILSLEVAKEGFAVTCIFNNPAHCVPPEERVEFCDSSVQGLCRCSAPQFVLQLLGGRSIVALHEGTELLSMKGCVLHSRVGESVRNTEEGKTSYLLHDCNIQQCITKHDSSFSTVDVIASSIIPMVLGLAFACR